MTRRTSTITRRCRVLISAAAAAYLLPFLAQANPPYQLRSTPHQLGFTLLGANGQPEQLPRLTIDDGGQSSQQVEYGSAAISPDGRTVGWLAYYANCCTSYSIPRELVLFRDGKVIRRFGSDGTPVWKWRFVGRGTAVEFHQNTVHGDFGPHYERRAIASGRLLAQYDGAADVHAPIWVRAFNQPP